MRMHTLVIALGAAVLSASALAAPPNSTADAGSAAMVPAQTVNGSSYKQRPVEFDGVQGSYDLSNGETMRISSQHRKLYAQIGGRGKAELVAVAPNVLVSRDDSLRLTFDQLPFAAGVRVTQK